MARPLPTTRGKSPEALREERGLVLAQYLRITRKASGVYVVPASSRPGSYVVRASHGRESCSCPDYELRGARCKHVWAVVLSRRKETMPNGAQKVSETLRVTYSQEWSAYNGAQTHEKGRALELLRSLCDGLTEKPQRGAGRRKLPISDRVFAMVAKVYGGMSTRRTNTDMREYVARGLLSKAPSYNALIDYFDDPKMSGILSRLIRVSAAPLASVEETLAIDSSGFSTCNYIRWFDHKYGRRHKEHEWIKAHIVIGTRTNVIVAAKVTGYNGADTSQLPELLAAAKRRFDLREFLADKGYLSISNQQEIVDAGAAPYIPFKKNSTMNTKSNKYRNRDMTLWRKLLGSFMQHREEFLAHYNQRYNVEATFSAVKRKFGGSIRSKTRVAQENELLAKLLCFNLSALVHEMFELDIAPVFWGKAS